MKLLILFTLLVSNSSLQANGCLDKKPSILFEEIVKIEKILLWATSVHNLLINEAFPDMSKHCRVEIQAGSIYADSFQFQKGEYAYMHAMRQEGQSIEEAKKMTESFIAKKYKKIRQLQREYDADKTKIDKRIRACFLRGMALHPIMDSTSPSHKGYQEWKALDINNIIKHGDVREALKKSVGFAFGVPHSHEDMNAIENDEKTKKLTILLMQQKDQHYMNLKD